MLSPTALFIERVNKLSEEIKEPLFILEKHTVFVEYCRPLNAMCSLALLTDT